MSCAIRFVQLDARLKWWITSNHCEGDSQNHQKVCFQIVCGTLIISACEIFWCRIKSNKLIFMSGCRQVCPTPDIMCMMLLFLNIVFQCLHRNNNGIDLHVHSYFQNFYVNRCEKQRNTKCIICFCLQLWVV